VQQQARSAANAVQSSAFSAIKQQQLVTKVAAKESFEQVESS